MDENFDWREAEEVAISPSADIIMFASHSPEKRTFFAKLRKEPINQYVTKSLGVPLDYDEQVTSLLCLPIMSSQRTGTGLVDWTALVVGLSSGYLRFYTEESVCLLSLKFSDEPIISLKCQTQRNNPNGRSDTHFAIIAEEILVTFRSSAVIIDGLGLFENLRIAKEEVVKNASNYEPAYNLTNLPSIMNCQRIKIEDSRCVLTDADFLGNRKTTTFDLLLMNSVDVDNLPPKSCARTVAFVGKNPFLSCYRESQEGGAHSVSELIGSIFTMWNKPQPSRAQMTEVSRSHKVTMFDRDRLATSIVSSPDRRLAAITDDFGRVLLVDATNLLVIRMWKGYRSAQCGWIEVKRDSDQRSSPRASFLVIYAPKRGLLEIWFAQRGPRVAAFNVGKNCRLLYSGFRMLNMRAELLYNRTENADLQIERSYSSHCYLLNAEKKTVFTIESPYTYSLYKFGDLKYRDQLLIRELVNAVQQNPEVDFVSEILHRVALLESIQLCIQKIATSFLPDKVIPIMESLINKTMKNYDNHSGETMTDDDMSIIELCKRLIRLCAIFRDLSAPISNELSLPDVNQRLIEQFEEHPKEIEDFAEQLGWSSTEILRYLSLLALERSYARSHQSSPWPSMGEPLNWTEFVSCFNLECLDRRRKVRRRSKESIENDEKLSIRLKEFNNTFLKQDKVIKTALFLYNRLSETYHKASESKSEGASELMKQLASSYNYLNPSSRLALLFQFWMSSKLCDHWKMWPFLQEQVGQISDELKVIAMSHESDKILIDTWKQIYNLILESDNIFAAITATAAIRSDTLRIIQDDEKREKLAREQETEDSSRNPIDWECLCIDAERMSILSQQLEDVFLLNLLLRYSPQEGHLVDRYLYRIPRISVANILQAGPTAVSELVAQWAIQADLSLKVFTEPYGQHEENPVVISSSTKRTRQMLAIKSLDKEEHAKELLHHAKTSYPCSLKQNIILIHCLWELCRRWTTSNIASSEKNALLKKANDCLHLFNEPQICRNLASVAFKTFFIRTFEQLVMLLEIHSNLMDPKNARLLDKSTRKSLNMADDCIESFVQFCCNLSELMLASYSDTNRSSTKECTEEMSSEMEKLLEWDSWWTTPTNLMDYREDESLGERIVEPYSKEVSTTKWENTLVKTVLYSSNLLDLNYLIEFNRIASLVNLILKLKVQKAHPVSLLDEESREILKMSAKHLPGHGTEVGKTRLSTSLQELRLKFARKCIINIVALVGEKVFHEEEDQTGDKVCHEVEEDQPNPAESLKLFDDLLSLATEWGLDRDELHLELVFELYRCNHDKLAAQVSTRVLDQTTLANGLLKIASQRILVLFAMSPYVSSSKWRRQTEKWGKFQPNVSAWLKSIQQEEIRREIARLSFADSSKVPTDAKSTYGLELYALRALLQHTRLMLDYVTSRVDGPAERLAFDLSGLLESKLFEESYAEESKLSKTSDDS